MKYNRHTSRYLRTRQDRKNVSPDRPQNRVVWAFNATLLTSIYEELTPKIIKLYAGGNCYLLMDSENMLLSGDLDPDRVVADRDVLTAIAHLKGMLKKL